MIRLDLNEMPPILATDPGWVTSSLKDYELKPCSPEFEEWRALNGIAAFKAVANNGLLHEYWKAANDEIRPAYISIFFNSDSSI